MLLWAPRPCTLQGRGREERGSKKSAPWKLLKLQISLRIWSGPPRPGVKVRRSCSCGGGQSSSPPQPGWSAVPRAPSIPLRVPAQAATPLPRLRHPCPESRLPRHRYCLPPAPSDPRTRGECVSAWALGEPSEPGLHQREGGREGTITFLPSPVSTGAGGPGCGPRSSWATPPRRPRRAGPAPRPAASRPGPRVRGALGPPQARGARGRPRPARRGGRGAPGQRGSLLAEEGAARRGAGRAGKRGQGVGGSQARPRNPQL